MPSLGKSKNQSATFSFVIPLTLSLRVASGVRLLARMKGQKPAYGQRAGGFDALLSVTGIPLWTRSALTVHDRPYPCYLKAAFLVPMFFPFFAHRRARVSDTPNGGTGRTRLVGSFSRGPMDLPTNPVYLVTPAGLGPLTRTAMAFSNLPSNKPTVLP